MMKHFAFLLTLLLPACGTGIVAPTAPLPAPIVTIISATHTPTGTPPPTPTRTMERAIFPYTIEGLRSHAYQSGKIQILKTSLETDTFTRYLIEYPSDGLKITGVLQIPKKGIPPFPVIVMNHGFFSRTVFSSGDGTDRAAEFLNRRGYLTVSSDYRSWGNSETGTSLFYSGLAIDVVNLINALPSIPKADPSRLGLWGHSMGGGVTLKVLTIDSRVKAAVMYSSVSGDFADIINRWGPGCLGDVLQGEATFGCNSSDVLPLDSPADLISAYFDSANDPAMLAAVSPIDHLDLVTAPVQIDFGSKDGLTMAGTPPQWSKKLYKAFKDAGKEAALFGYDGELHSFKADQWFAFMERSAQFYDKYVRP
jgi:dipeptidyl aminopeptidase/acylaminoacyl peptidase